MPIESLHYLLSGQAVMMCLLGGMGTFFGPFVGAAVFLTLEDVVTTLTRHWMAVVGAVFMVFVLFFPRGIWGTLVKRLESRPVRADERRMTAPILEVDRAQQRFGRFVALNDVSVALRAAAS